MTVNMYNVKQLNNVLMFCLLEKGNLSDSCARNALVLALESDFLQSDNTVGIVQLSGFVDNTVCS
jgi:hypothetical protein